MSLLEEANQAVGKVRSAAAGPFPRSLRCEIRYESTDSPAVSRLDLEKNDSSSLSKHFFIGLMWFLFYMYDFNEIIYIDKLEFHFGGVTVDIQ